VLHPALAVWPLHPLASPSTRTTVRANVVLQGYTHAYDLAERCLAPLVLLAASQVSKATTLNHFEAGTVTLSASASARPGGLRNDTVLQDTVEVDVALTQAPGMAVSIALASDQPSIYSSPGAHPMQCGPSWVNV
jgi:hypothetical protein